MSIIKSVGGVIKSVVFEKIWIRGWNFGRGSNQGYTFIFENQLQTLWLLASGRICHLKNVTLGGLFLNHALNRNEQSYISYKEKLNEFESQWKFDEERNAFYVQVPTKQAAYQTSAYFSAKVKDMSDVEIFYKSSQNQFIVVVKGAINRLYSAFDLDLEELSEVDNKAVDLNQSPQVINASNVTNILISNNFLTTSFKQNNDILPSSNLELVPRPDGC